MRFGKNWRKGLFFTLCFAAAWGRSVHAQGGLATVKEEAQVCPMPDDSGCYLLKSDRFYCLKEDGSLDKTPGIHFFDHFVIDGTVFDGYYYHDESGIFSAHAPYMVHIKNLSVPSLGEQEETPLIFDGCYMAGSLGKLSAAPQVRYIDQLSLNGKEFCGYYFFDEKGRLVEEPGIHKVQMVSNGRAFDGSYYFGGKDGLLSEEKGVTPGGLRYDEQGKVEEVKYKGIKGLRVRLKALTKSYEGEWSVYVKDLKEGVKDSEILINNKPLYSASLIKAFVMEQTFFNAQDVKKSLGLRMRADSESDQVDKRMKTLLTNMITVSDNESFNELVRLQTDTYGFTLGARRTNRYLRERGYEDTAVLHTLAPSVSAPIGIGENNLTSVKDCGLLLERIYNGECVSKKASQAMLELLLAQKVVTKIPEPLGEEVRTANKTGETDTDQHDIAIVFGQETDYILCVMSENCPNKDTAIQNIRNISQVVYDCLNPGQLDSELS